MNAQAAWAAVLLASGVSAVARAQIVHFINPAPGQPGHYDWSCPLEYGAYDWLDILLDPGAQSSTATGSGVSQYASSLFTLPPNRTNFHFSQDGVGAMVLARRTSFGMTTAFVPNGITIGPNPEGADWAAAAFHGLPNPFAEHQYLGVHTSSGHYGWIAVSRADVSLTLHAWAYETQPGVPIVAGAIPAPAATALLAVAFLTANRRRRS